MPTQPWSDEEEVIKRANDSLAGLGACVWGNDIERAERIARRLEAGSVWVNSWEKPTPQALFGGHKQSGIGGGKYPKVHIRILRHLLTISNERMGEGGTRAPPICLMKTLADHFLNFIGFEGLLQPPRDPLIQAEVSAAPNRRPTSTNNERSGETLPRYTRDRKIYHIVDISPTNIRFLSTAFLTIFVERTEDDRSYRYPIRPQ